MDPAHFVLSKLDVKPPYFHALTYGKSTAQHKQQFAIAMPGSVHPSLRASVAIGAGSHPRLPQPLSGQPHNVGGSLIEMHGHLSWDARETLPIAKKGSITFSCMPGSCPNARWAPRSPCGKATGHSTGPPVLYDAVQ